MAALVLEVKRLLIHLLHGRVVSENDGHSQIATMADVTGDITCLVSAIDWATEISTTEPPGKSLEPNFFKKSST